MYRSNYCVCCGKEIPEGRLVCWGCENKEALNQKEKVINKPKRIQRIKFKNDHNKKKGRSVDEDDV